MLASMGGMGGSTRSGNPGGCSSPPRTGDFDFLPNTARDHNRSSRRQQPAGPVRRSDVVADLLGDSVILRHSHLFAKLPGDAKRVAWHQDAA